MRFSRRRLGPSPTTRNPQVRLSRPQTVRHGREGPDEVALVRVDVRSEEVRELAGALELAAEVVAAGRGHPQRARRRFPEQVPRRAQVPQAAVHVTGRPGEVFAPLRHERHGDAVERGDLFCAVLEQRVPVGHLHRSGVAQVDLVLAGTPLALAELDRDAAALHAVPDLADEPLLPGALQDVVILHVLAVGLEVVIVLRAAPARTSRGTDVEFELRRQQRHHAPPVPRARPGPAGSGAATPRSARRRRRRRRTARARSVPATAPAAACRGRAAAGRPGSRWPSSSRRYPGSGSISTSHASR